MQKMTLEEYLFKNGVGYCVSDYNLDKIRLPHGETMRQKQRRLKTGERVEREYQEKRQKAIAEYKQLVESGKIQDKTKEELLIERANGHPDNESVQAARRLCEKRGINWKNQEVLSK